MTKEKEACCEFWNRNMEKIHSGLTMAALNGNPTTGLDSFKFCPWCGLNLNKRKDLEE
jgi:hypothetical protein